MAHDWHLAKIESFWSQPERLTDADVADATTAVRAAIAGMRG